MTDAGLQGLIGKEQEAKSHSREPIKRGSSRKGAGLTPESEKEPSRAVQGDQEEARGCWNC